MTLAFQSLGSILLGYSLVFGITGLYALFLVRRGRNLARRLPDDDKPWTGRARGGARFGESARAQVHGLSSSGNRRARWRPRRTRNSA